jgi:thiol-disulfide isomerase/thioredoxin
MYFLFFCILSLLLLLKYLFKNIKNNKYKENKEYENKVNTKDIKFLVFHATWCPYSKNTLEKLDNIKKEYINDKKFNYEFDIIDVDKFSDMAENYNIESYPTIILLYNNKKYIYDAELDESTFRYFVNTVTNDNKKLRRLIRRLIFFFKK